MEHEVLQYFAEANQVPPEVREIDLLRNRCHVIRYRCQGDHRLAVVREVMKRPEPQVLFLHALGLPYRELAYLYRTSETTARRMALRGREIVEAEL